MLNKRPPCPPISVLNSNQLERNQTPVPNNHLILKPTPSYAANAVAYRKGLRNLGPAMTAEAKRVPNLVEPFQGSHASLPGVLLASTLIY